MRNCSQCWSITNKQRRLAITIAAGHDLSDLSTCNPFGSRIRGLKSRRIFPSAFLLQCYCTQYGDMSYRSFGCICNVADGPYRAYSFGLQEPNGYVKRLGHSWMTRSHCTLPKTNALHALHSNILGRILYFWIATYSAHAIFDKSIELCSHGFAFSRRIFTWYEDPTFSSRTLSRRYF